MGIIDLNEFGLFFLLPRSLVEKSVKSFSTGVNFLWHSFIPTTCDFDINNLIVR